MRRVAVVLGTVAAALWVAVPASAFAHNKVANPYLHAVLDVLVLAVVTAPLWTAYLWGVHRRGLLMALVGVVQLPVAVIGFVPVVHPVIHAIAFVVALSLTAAGLRYVRRAATSAETGPDPLPADPR
jgi:hypothetical protein